MLGLEDSIENYIPLKKVVEEGKRNKVNILFKSLKWRIDHEKISAVRDPNNIRKRRLVLAEELPDIIAYYSQLQDSKTENYRDLSELAENVGLKSRSLHPRAEKLGIITTKIGNRRVMTKREYDKWRIILDRRKKYLSTGFIGRSFGVSHHLIVYYVKRGIIPAVKIGSQYRVSKLEFEENKEEWRKQCCYLGNNKV